MPPRPARVATTPALAPLGAHVSVAGGVSTAIERARAIGATVVAEGIHSEDEVRALMDLGVVFGQGFHLARPDPGPEPTS